MSIPTLEPQIPGPAAAPTAVRGRDFIAGAIGLAIGVTAALGLILLPTFAAPAPLPAAESPFKTAVDECSVDWTYVHLLDDGAALELNTAGSEDAGAEYSDVECILKELDISESILSHIGTTRALDGRQDGRWNVYAASWTYHPDPGLSILVELDEN